ncbi:hypothetical protein SPRG_10870 [Saprolegnia parasitica CBS 223.65]|uniref:Uncharacterized protein n=1 Tax=Saprolegnia parasitica (strain CBS 223.65) TaxID=695850 RepID=A0A067C0N0_SAPPC|nr:hypothetical protein SPRG_10870 [Saprolegnia parasitica CBS 223.65]KDO24083.1 hypothetical protein SPRG_10870 [Saprolegnia parasitica CBS 223.65]|eukprot:XP_012205219.1 hypothetical protein SPRG_10870 [Saprolegnia parasitica CBS 223.65]
MGYHKRRASKPPPSHHKQFYSPDHDHSRGTWPPLAQGVDFRGSEQSQPGDAIHQHSSFIRILYPFSGHNALNV